MRSALCVAGALWLAAWWVPTPQAQDRTNKVRHRTDATLFAPSTDCVACHNNLITPQGEDISIGSKWRSTIMANSGRDPYFQAALRREVTDHPAAAAEIQHECAACHMPMLHRTAEARGEKADVFAQLPIGEHDSAQHMLAADGVSCTVCHQISDSRLGTRDSFNGGFVLTPTPDNGVRPIFGPFEIDRGRTTIMRSATGFEQSEAKHVRQSELCATCHTLYTEARGPGGAVIGSLPEQMNFLEWQHSSYRDEQSCQSCHMPPVDETTRMASVLGDPREGLARHLFVGGNAFMLRMLNRYRSELGVAASSSELEATTQATLRQLEQQTARVSIVSTERSGNTLSFDVDVVSLTGHKMPTGYPSRRAWLHVAVLDAGGRAIFESGAVEDSGLIRGNDNDADATAVEPHYDEIRRGDEVQIYESVMADTNGAITTALLQATQYVKDNRLLPRGFDKATANADIAVRGGASDDGSFTGGGDRVRYVVPLGQAQGPFAIDVELRYQPIGFRWAQNLVRYDSPEPRRFVAYFNAMARSSSVVLARTSSSVGLP